MKANVGDRLHVHVRTVGEVDKVGTIIEVHGEDGAEEIQLLARHDVAPASSSARTPSTHPKISSTQGTRSV